MNPARNLRLWPSFWKSVSINILYSRSTSGAGNLQLGTKILIVPHIGNFKLQLKKWGHPKISCYFSSYACRVGWPHVNQVKFRVA